MHDTGRGPELKRRVQTLTPDTKPQWGKMSVDQMLHHVNFVLAEALGEHTAKPKRARTSQTARTLGDPERSLGEGRADAAGHAHPAR
jgi:hypothetical protein